MLTKEEAQELMKKLGIVEHQSLGDSILFPVYVLLKIVKDFTEKPEKPRREIQVGDIYRNKYGGLKEIRDIDMSKERPIRAIFTSYRLDGQYLTSEPSKDDLDLSKRYKLTEVEDVD